MRHVYGHFVFKYNWKGILCKLKTLFSVWLCDSAIWWKNQDRALTTRKWGRCPNIAKGQRNKTTL